MAGESIGKLCEAAVALSLNRTGIPSERVFWNAKPAGMSITTDFAIGPSADAPDVVLLVTHSISPMQSHKKFWRNIGELVELKTFLSSEPVVINVVFGSARMEKLTSVILASMDYALEIATLSGGPELLTEIATLTRRAKGMSREETLGLLSRDLSLRALNVLGALGTTIKTMIESRTRIHPELWEKIRGARKPIQRTHRTTSVKRGLAKFLLFDESDRRRLFIAAKSNKGLASEPPSLAKSLGFVGGLGNRRVIDLDMLSFAKDWGEDDLEYVIAHAPSDDLDRIAVGPLRAVVNLPSYALFVREHRPQLIQAAWMEHAIRACHNDPESLLPLLAPVQTVWLVDYLFSIIKASLGGHNDYGQSQLAEDIALRTGITSSGYRIFADWLNRRPKGVLPDTTIKSIAVALSKRLASITPAALEQAIDALPSFYVRTFLNIKLLTYEKLEPLQCFLERELRRHGIEYLRQKRINSIWGELAGSNSATSSAILTKDGILFYSSSVTEAGRDHKRKELEGRGAGIRWRRADNGKVRLRNGIRRMILVVDGTWEQTDFEFLGLAGWDEVIYADEIRKFVEKEWTQTSRWSEFRNSVLNK